MRAAAALALLLCASGEAADLKELQARLRDKDDRARAEAIEELGRLGSDEAFGLVLEGFKDPSSRVPRRRAIGPAARHRRQARQARQVADRKSVV